jgi:hypothetical protein
VKKLLVSLIAGCFVMGVVSITGCNKDKDKDKDKTTTTKTTETKEKETKTTDK